MSLQPDHPAFWLLLCLGEIDETDQRADSRQQVAQIPYAADDSTDKSKFYDPQNCRKDAAGDSTDDPDCDKADEFLFVGSSIKTDIFGFDDIKVSVNDFFDIHKFLLL